MFDKFKRIRSRFNSPFTDWIQIEISSHCPSSCIYCPHTIYKDRWLNQYMSPNTFKKIVPALYKTRLAYLQGWGEPFSHPEFFRLLKMAKKAGCMVGTSTNGMLLDQAKIEQMIDGGLDIIALSLAGLEETNDRFRCGTGYEKVIEVCRLIKEIKARRKSDQPQIHIAFLLLRSGLKELENLTANLKDLGIAQVVLSTLDFIPSQELAKETIHPQDESEYEDFKKRLDKLAIEAAQNNFSLHYHLRHPHHRQPVCTENVLKTAFVAVDGSVAPCVFMKLPLKEGSYFVDGRETVYKSLAFGNINSESFDEIWNRTEYREFRAGFAGGQPHQSCLGCPKLYMT